MCSVLGGGGANTPELLRATTPRSQPAAATQFTAITPAACALLLPALLPARASGTDGGEGHTLEKFNFRDILAALHLRHALGLWDVGIVVKNQDDGGNAVIAEKV